MAAMRLMGKPTNLNWWPWTTASPTRSRRRPRSSRAADIPDNEGSLPAPPLLAADSDFMASDLGELSARPRWMWAGGRAQGYIDGDATPLLQPFEAHFKPGVPLTIACDKLIRVDFAAQAPCSTGPPSSKATAV